MNCIHNTALQISIWNVYQREVAALIKARQAIGLPELLEYPDVVVNFEDELGFYWSSYTSVVDHLIFHFRFDAGGTAIIPVSAAPSVQTQAPIRYRNEALKRQDDIRIEAIARDVTDYQQAKQLPATTTAGPRMTEVFNVGDGWHRLVCDDTHNYFYMNTFTGET